MATPLQVELSLSIEAHVFDGESSLRDVPDDRLNDCLAIVYAWYDDLALELRHRLNLGQASRVKEVLSRDRAQIATPEHE